MISAYQQQLALLGRLDAPAFLPAASIAECRSYRDAVRLCWMHRRVMGMTQRTLAELIGTHAPHVTDYLAGDDEPSRRDLPAKRIGAMEAVCGNRAISQWLARDTGLHLVEEMMRAA